MNTPRFGPRFCCVVGALLAHSQPSFGQSLPPSTGPKPGDAAAAQLSVFEVTAIRLEPTWMSLAEAAAVAAVIALREHKTPADIKPDELVRALAERKVLLAFFNDIEGKQDEPWYGAVQYFGTQGFFANYDARANEPLVKPLAEAWLRAARELARGANIDRTERARQIMAAESLGGEPVNADFFLQQLSELAGTATTSSAPANLLKELAIDSSVPLSRGSVCRLMLAALGHHKVSSPK